MFLFFKKILLRFSFIFCRKIIFLKIYVFVFLKFYFSVHKIIIYLKNIKKDFILINQLVVNYIFIIRGLIIYC